MTQTYQPFLGDFSQYGQGPEHNFFLQGVLAGDDLFNQQTAPAVDPTAGGLDLPSLNDSGANGGGYGGADDTRSTNSFGDFAGSIIGAPVTPIGITSLLANIALNKNEEMTEMGLLGFGKSALGFGNPTAAEIENAMNSPAFGGPTTGPTAGDIESVTGNPELGMVGQDVGGDTSGNSGGIGGNDGGVGAGGGAGGGASGGAGGGASDGGATAADGGFVYGDDIINYAGGGYVLGEGGGMDDSVPAHIDGVQPAALSSGEMVIPADVVAMIGDGNNAAGAKKLDQLISQVRKQKYGRDKQPPKMKRGLASLLA